MHDQYENMKPPREVLKPLVSEIIHVASLQAVTLPRTGSRQRSLSP